MFDFGYLEKTEHIQQHHGNLEKIVPFFLDNFLCLKEDMDFFQSFFFNFQLNIQFILGKEVR